MKNDYLWEKKGSDPDIERLEGLLSGFGYAEEPAAVSNVVAFPVKAKLNLQPWVFAMAACVALAAIAIGVWNLGFLSGEAPPVETVSVIEEFEAPAPPDGNVQAALTEERNIVIPTSQPVVAANKRKTSVRPKYAAVGRKRPFRRDPAMLTAEEKFAYNQLMLALSITSSKWQVVQDSINGVEDGRTDDR